MSAFPWMWQNGAVIAAAEFRLPPDDPALAFGLGAFTTTWASRHAVRLWPRHAERLRNTAAALGFACPPLPEKDALQALVAFLNVPACAFRCNVSPSGRVWCVARPLPAASAGVALRSEPAPWAAADPWGSLKTFHYGQRWLAGDRARAAGFDDALLLDAAGWALETTRANLFMLGKDGWKTPPAGPGVLPGVVRAELLRLGVGEAPIALPDLLGAHEAFLSNSVRGLVPIRAVDGHALRLGTEWRTFLPALDG